MRVHRIIADLQVDDIAQASAFYRNFLGLTDEEFNLGWVARFSAPGGGPSIQLVTDDASAAESPALSVMTDDIDAAWREARERGYEIVHPLTREPWGVLRFFVRSPDGVVINVVNHPRVPATGDVDAVPPPESPPLP